MYSVDKFFNSNNLIMNSSKPSVISYLRFSDPRQSKNTSIKRQLQYTQDFANNLGIPINESLTLKDEGLSAYHSHHIKKGALGVFLKAVDDGKVSEGSFLVIEALDRLTRTEPMDAIALLTQIVKAGITVVTASDNQQYSKESITDNPMQLMMSLMLMIRAHEESETKSRRVKDAIRIKCENWQSIEESGFINNGKDPDWVKRADNSFELIPERVQAVRLIVKLYMKGFGGSRIVDTLKRKNLSPSNKPPHAERIYRIVKSSLLTGVKELKVNEQVFKLKQYYPPVLTINEYNLLREAQSKRVSQKGQKRITGIFTGIGLSFCGYCGAAMNGQNYSHRMRNDGSLADGHRRLICSAHNATRNCTVGSSFSIVPIEKALLEFCSDKLELSKLMSTQDECEPLINARTSHFAKLKEIKDVTANLMKTLETGDRLPQVILTRMTELEVEQKKLETEIEKLTVKINTISNINNPNIAERWQKVKADIDAFDHEARSSIAQLFSQTFKRIEVFVKGFEASNSNTISGAISKRLFSTLINDQKPHCVDIRLISHNGQNRLLRINKSDTSWIRIVDVDFKELSHKKVR